MSWGGSIIDLKGVTSFDELPSDYTLPSLGSREEVNARLCELLPELQITGEQLSLVTDSLSLEFTPLKVGDVEGISSIGVRSNGDDSLWGYLRIICEGFGTTLVDHQSGEIADLDDVSNSTLAEYRDFANRCRSKISSHDQAPDR